MRHLMIVLTGALALSPLVAVAQEGGAKAAAVCAAMDVSLTPDVAAWTSKAPIDAAPTLALTKAAALTAGKAYTVMLHPTPHVGYVVQPEKPGGSVSSGGMFSVHVEQAGTYGIALGSAAWIDLIKDGKAMQAASFGHGPDCTTIRKIVNFELTPGDYVLQISANAEAQLPVMVFRKP